MSDMLPRVIVHNTVSVDGCIEGHDRRTALYYQLAGAFGADTVLEGADTALQPEDAIPPEGPLDSEKPRRDPGLPLKVIPDSRGRLRNWHVHRRDQHYADVAALVSHATAAEFLRYLSDRNIDYVVAGDDHVDYRRAFELLYERFGTRVIRTDSGGVLASILFREGLVSELSLLVNPALVGTSARALFRTLDLPAGSVCLRLRSAEAVGGGSLWLRYEVGSCKAAEE